VEGREVGGGEEFVLAVRGEVAGGFKADGDVVVKGIAQPGGVTPDDVVVVIFGDESDKVTNSLERGGEIGFEDDACVKKSSP
jgi:hypothetical protein